MLSKRENALTIDVEDWFQVAAFFPYIKQSTWGGLESRVERNTYALLKVLDDRHVRATFFVLGWIAEKYPKLIAKIAAAGHEIACHGFSHKLVYTQTPDEFQEETHRAKNILESITGNPVLGYRASTYSITHTSLWALDILVEEGFKYDSSIFPVRHPQYGIPGASRFPGVVQTPKGARIVEFPMSTAKIAGIQLPVAGGGYFRQFPYLYTRIGLHWINDRENKPFIFYMHPWEIDPGQPRPTGLKMLTRIRHYNNLDRTGERLLRLLTDFKFVTVHQVLENEGLLPSTKTLP